MIWRSEPERLLGLVRIRDPGGGAGVQMNGAGNFNEETGIDIGLLIELADQIIEKGFGFRQGIDKRDGKGRRLRALGQHLGEPPKYEYKAVTQ